MMKPVFQSAPSFAKPQVAIAVADLKARYEMRPQGLEH
jgi:hypothetical protein